jgi:hypothetical protein
MARAHVAHCWQLLVQNRLQRTIAFVEKYFVGSPAGDSRYLAMQSRGYIEADHLGDELSAYVDPETEIGHGLKRLPANWQAVRAACAIEEGLTTEIPAGFAAEIPPTSASPYLVHIATAPSSPVTRMNF